MFRAIINRCFDWAQDVQILRGISEHCLLRCDRGSGVQLNACLRHGGIPAKRAA
jgi:hypothetical protein